MSESALVHAALEWFARNRVRVRRNNSGAVKVDGRWIRYGGEGEGDILGQTPYGRYLEAEAKSASGRQRAAQKKHQAIVERHHGIYVLFRSIDDLEAQRHLLVGTPDVIREYGRLLLERNLVESPVLTPDRLNR